MFMHKHNVIFAAFLSLFIFFIQIFFELRVGFDLADEGYLWYGVQRTMAGFVPIRDFMSYDPGRYYLCSLFMNLFGDNGIYSLRISIYFFQAIAIFYSVYILSKYLKKISIILFCILAYLWMIPYFKSFDHILSIFLIFIGTFIFEGKNDNRFIISGICLGLIAFFGRNHGLYGIIGITLCIFLSFVEDKSIDRKKEVLSFVFGIIIGYLPMIIVILYKTGFYKEFTDSIKLIFELGTTNIALPVPWFSSKLGIFFFLLLIIPVVSLVFYLKKYKTDYRKNPLLFSSIIFSFIYPHYAFSRADIVHLSLGLFPTLFVIVIVFNSIVNYKYLATICFVVIIFISAQACKRQHKSYASMEKNHEWVNCLVGKDILLIEKSSDEIIRNAKFYTEKYAKNDKYVLFTPYSPGLYPITNKLSPVYEIYALFNQSDKFQEKEIKSTENSNVNLIVLDRKGIDLREDLTYLNTHKNIFKYIESKYVLNEKIYDNVAVYTKK